MAGPSRAHSPMSQPRPKTSKPPAHRRSSNPKDTGPSPKRFPMAARYFVSGRPATDPGATLQPAFTACRTTTSVGSPAKVESVLTQYTLHHFFILRNYFVSYFNSASLAATCCAACLLGPVPVLTKRGPAYTPRVNTLSWSGPTSSSTTYRGVTLSIRCITS